MLSEFISQASWSWSLLTTSRYGKSPSTHRPQLHLSSRATAETFPISFFPYHSGQSAERHRVGQSEQRELRPPCTFLLAYDCVHNWKKITTYKTSQKHQIFYSTLHTYFQRRSKSHQSVFNIQHRHFSHLFSYC